MRTKLFDTYFFNFFFVLIPLGLEATLPVITVSSAIANSYLRGEGTEIDRLKHLLGVHVDLNICRHALHDGNVWNVVVATLAFFLL